MVEDIQILCGLKLQEWIVTKDEKTGDSAGVDKRVKFCELATLSIMYWAECNEFNVINESYKSK